MDKKTEEFFAVMTRAVIDEEELGMKSSFKAGDMCAFNSYEESVLDEPKVEGREIIECRKLPEAGDEVDFMRLFREAGVREIAITDSNNLIRFLHRAFGLNGKIAGVCTVLRKEYPGLPADEVKGVLFQF